MAADFISCSIEGCNKPIFNRRGWCSAHYAKWRKYGNPLHKVRKTETGEALSFVRNSVLSFRSDECLSWPFGQNATGYGAVYVDGCRKLAHRFVCETVNGPQPAGKPYALHSCGNGHLGCVNPRHLYWGNQKQNMKDMIRDGRSQRGSKHYLSKLTESDVEEIRSLKGKMFQREIAALYGVHKETIGHIHRGKRWAWLNN